MLKTLKNVFIVTLSLISYYLIINLTNLKNANINCGFIFFLIIFCLFNSIKNKHSLLIYVPFIGLWLSLLIASPAIGEYCYIFGAVVTLSLYFIYSLNNDKIEIEENKK